ncbi:MAG: hypothetical protein LCI03_07380 [Actinobacteria bacterium]|nr:hypothetical protein [Actinomycetota bacterium]
MTTLQEIHAVKDRAVVAMREAGIERGVRNLLTQLYPDNAHFIYELLQNAEDAEATEVIFDLQPDRLIFKHDGRPFTIDDVESILSIGDTTKTDDPTAIGKFGVGFKAVFSYCSTPQIRSGNFAFSIRDLIVPEPLPSGPSSSWTEFCFPFDNPSKPADRAYDEIRAGLIGLDGSTLLFLTRVTSLMYLIPGETDGLIERRELVGDGIAVVREGPAGAGVEHWLRLADQVEMTPEGADQPKLIPIAAAFRLEPAEDGSADKQPATSGDGGPPVRLRVAALEDGDARVAIFFPAVKERSGLRFHIHAGFASTVARDSVTDHPDNTVLVEAIGAMLAKRLPGLLRQGLLTDELLAALPNDADTLHARYVAIRHAVVQAFHDHQLTPVFGSREERAHADDLVASPPSVRRALTPGDLQVLTTLELGERETPYRWVAERPGRAGAFLRSLGIEEFGWKDLSSMLGSLSGQWIAHPEPRPTRSSDCDGDLHAWLTWLESKDDKQLRRVYSLLGEAHENVRWPRLPLKALPLIRRVARGKVEHVRGPSIYLPASRSDKAASRVHAPLAPFADDRPDKENAGLRTFYEAAGVQVWNKTTQVRARLDAYRAGNHPDRDQNIKDVTLFRDYLAADPDRASEFGNATFLIGETALVQTYWAAARDVFVDAPFRDTALSDVYFADPFAPTTKYRLWRGYRDLEGVDDFVAALGGITQLAVVKTEPWRNPEFQHSWRTGRETHAGTRRDWDLPTFDAVVASGNPVLLRALWDCLAPLAKDRARAVYQCNAQTTPHPMRSTLAHKLESTPWILDIDGNLRLPHAISADELADGFKAPASGGLLDEVGFGRDAAANQLERMAADVVAEQVGLSSGDVLRRIGAALSGRSDAEVEQLLAQLEATAEADWEVDGSPSEDPERRVETARSLALGAPERRYEVRERSIAVGAGAAIVEAKSYLRDHYLRRDGRVGCQACHRPMPFRVGDQDYFEAVQFLRTLRAEHYQNRLALCPVCAAMYKHAKATTDNELSAALRELATDLAEPGAAWGQVSVVLAGNVHDLRFAAKHALELIGILTPGESNNYGLGV